MLASALDFYVFDELAVVAPVLYPRSPNFDKCPNHHANPWARSGIAY